jgi:MSHA biogenesis protein MshP
MCRNIKQQGFSLIMAIFLIVVLGGIAVFIGRVTTMQIQSSALDEEGVMAYQAARSGIEWGVYQAVVDSSCIASTSFILPVPATLTGNVNYTVTVTCTQATVSEGSSSSSLYQIAATANNASGGNFGVERKLTATVSQ